MSLIWLRTKDTDIGPDVAVASVKLLCTTHISTGIKIYNANIQLKEGTMQYKVYFLSLCFDEWLFSADELENGYCKDRRASFLQQPDSCLLCKLYLTSPSFQHSLGIKFIVSLRVRL